MINHLKNIYELKSHLSDDLISLYYKGEFNDSFSEFIISLADHDSHKSVRKKLSYLMIEVFQNIVRHGEDFEESKDCFSVRSIEDGLHIFSSNNIDKKTYTFLNSKLKELNQLNPEELKSLYIEILQSREFSEKGGAGLGLINMARKSGNAIQHNFKELQENAYQFNYQLDISSERGVALTKDQNIDIHENINLYSNITDDKILFYFKGDFSKDNIHSLLNILKANTQNFSKNEEFNSFRIFHTGVELIQNISRHGKSVNNFIEGVFSLSQANSGYYISTGNFLNKGDLSNIEEHLFKLNQYSKDELKQIYLETLKKNSLEDNNNAGVGLIDVRRYNQSFIDHEIHNYDNGIYLSMGVFIPIFN